MSVKQLLNEHKAASITWLALVAATVVAYLLGHSSQMGLTVATVGVIIAAFVKVWLIGFQFMELGHAPGWLRHLYDAWLAVIAVVLIVICLS